MASGGRNKSGRDRRLELASNVPRIQTSRRSRVGRALDDGSPVGEVRHLVGFAPELQYEVIVPHNSMPLKPSLHLNKVDCAAPLVNLHRISSTQRDVGTAFARKMNEFP